MGKRKGNQRESAFVGLSDEIVEERARDPRINPVQREKYKRDAKARRKRNKQKDRGH